MSALSGHGTLVSSGQHPAIIKHFPADVRGLAGSVCHHGLCLGKGLGQFVVDIIKRHAVVGIAGGNHSLQYTAVLVAGTVRFVGRAPLMLSFVKQPTLRVCGRYRHRFCPFAAFFRRAVSFSRCCPASFRQSLEVRPPHQASFFPYASRSAFTSARDSAPALSASSKIHRNTASIVSSVIRCRKLLFSSSKLGNNEFDSNRFV